MGILDKVNKLSIFNHLQGGMGERLTQFFAKLDISNTFVLHDVLIDGFNENTSQIDLVIINEKGIFVVEVKLYTDAKIYGDGRKRNWYYYKYGKKYEIYSPIMQNKNHIKYLKQFLNDFKEIPYFSVIVLLCDDFKISNINNDIANPDTVIVSGLLSLKKAIDLISKGKSNVLNEDQQQSIYIFIQQNQYQGRNARIEHKQRIKEIYNDIEDNKKICPYCKNLLVRRKGKYGEFYGCSGYPKCKYTKKLEE